MSNSICNQLSDSEIHELHRRYEAEIARARETVMREGHPGEYRDFQLSRLKSITFERFEAKVCEIANTHDELDLLLQWLGDVR